MRMGIRQVFAIVPFISLIALVWAGIGFAYADCRWVRLGGDVYQICDGNQSPEVTKRIVPTDAVARTEMRGEKEPATQTVSGVVAEQGERWRLLARESRHSSQRARQPMHQDGQWVSKRFRTSVMGARVKGTVERRGDDLRGVVYVYPPLGHKSTYHFNGKIQGNRVVAWHNSGHVFRGEIVGGQRVVGVVTTRRGNRIPLDVPTGLP